MNAMPTFNTLDAVRRIEAAGLERAKAEAVVDEIAHAQADLFTKADGEALEARLRGELGRLDSKIERTAAQTTRWLFTGMFLVNGFVATVLFFALKH
jgi:hypothetical protein